tara:strand:+ start:278 stop:439 length:162 start_codon:yes stop_codon:yes gene_type:complete
VVVEPPHERENETKKTTTTKTVSSSFLEREREKKSVLYDGFIQRRKAGVLIKP